ncbi:MAG: hypothetical protein JST55_06395 [Bacteroidetes bacterium]|nr:hypothetical protein [Bacteroidota bacterium]
MSKIYGTYARTTLQDLWHSRKDCSQYPDAADAEFMVSTKPIPVNEICPECLELDIKTAKIVSLDTLNEKLSNFKLFL